MQRISNKAWQNASMGESLFLCQLPLTVTELESKLAVKFEHRKQGGTSVRSLFVELAGQQLCLLSVSGRTVKEIGVRVHMHANQTDPAGLLDSLLNELKICHRQLARVGRYMGPPQYILSRLDNNNEVEVTRLHDQILASRLLKKLEGQNRKQRYFIQTIQDK